jgi:transposase
MLSEHRDLAVAKAFFRSAKAVTGVTPDWWATAPTGATSRRRIRHIEEQPVAGDAGYDGLYLLRTNTNLDALAVMLLYRELLNVEDTFRTTKAIRDTRPIYFQKDATIRGHVFCSFLRVRLIEASAA